MLNANISILSNRLRVQRGLLFGLLIVMALLAFELFNYSTAFRSLTQGRGSYTTEFHRFDESSRKTNNN